MNDFSKKIKGKFKYINIIKINFLYKNIIKKIVIIINNYFFNNSKYANQLITLLSEKTSYSINFSLNVIFNLPVE